MGMNLSKLWETMKDREAWHGAESLHNKEDPTQPKINNQKGYTVHHREI